MPPAPRLTSIQIVIKCPIVQYFCFLEAIHVPEYCDFYDDDDDDEKFINNSNYRTQCIFITNKSYS